MTPPRRLRHGLTLTAVGALAAAALAQLPVTTGPALAAAPANEWFERVATYPVYQNLPAGSPASTATVAEISTVSKDGNTMYYSDAPGKRVGILDITDPAAPVGKGAFDLARTGHADDQPTSVGVVGNYLLAVVDETGTTAEELKNPKGRVDVYDTTTKALVRSIDLGGQPDSIAVSKDEKYVAIAIENQRNETVLNDNGTGAVGDLPQAPRGFLQVLDLPSPTAPAGWTVTKVDLPSTAISMMTEPTDAEPEYVDINADNKIALTLQENNGVVVVDAATKAITSAWSAGSSSLTNVDTANDGELNLTGTLSSRPREPDAIKWVGPNLVATANEGDWKGGTRGWTVFNATTGAVVWDSGTQLEYLAAAHGLTNEARSGSKGTEPEGMAFDTFNGTPYAFVGSERSNFVATYDMTDPTKPVFRQMLPATNGPEGLLTVPARGLLLTSSETDSAANLVRASVGVYKIGTTTPAFPSIASLPTDGSSAPITWTPLGALSAAPGDPTHLWTASDAVLTKQAKIYSVDVTKTPAVIDRTIAVTTDGTTKLPLDIEGLSARAGGGFWVGVEGATGPENKLVRLSATGVREEEVSLPTEVSSHIRNWGIEGVAVSGAGTSEQLYVALQRPLWVDPSVGANDVVESEGHVARIGRYDVTAKTWTWFKYPLQNTSISGDWMGLSEITMVDSDTVAVIERDKQNGLTAAVKRLYTVDIPANAAPGSVTTVTKKLAFDVLPTLRATKGWTQEKLEGMTIGADNNVYAVTDNDGLSNATGETVFMRLGAMTSVFKDSLGSTTSLSLSSPSTEVGSAVAASVSLSPGVSGGTVRILDGTTVVGTGTPDAAGRVSIPVNAGAGAHLLTASWSGTSTRLGSSSASVLLTVRKAASTTSLSAPRKVRAGKKVSLRATVAPGSTGTVTFTDGRKVLGTAPVSSGVAVLKAKLKGTGKHTVVATYSGSDAVAGSTAQVKVKVKRR